MKKLAILFLLLPALVWAQSYPSPTYKGVTITNSFSAPGLVHTTDLAAQAANTVVANVTGSSASPTAFALPSCSTSSSAITYASGTGFTCNTAVNAATLGGATFAAPGPIGGTTPSTIGFTTGTSTLGSSGAPISTAAATTINSTLYSNYGAGAGSNNPPNGITSTVHNYGTSTANNNNVRAVFGQAIDHGGNTGLGVANNNFVEGGRFHGTAAAGVAYTATYGLVTYANNAAGQPYMFIVGHESQADNQYQNAPATSSFSANQFSTAFLASVGESSGTFTADAGFMMNPFNPSKVQTGFLVAGNTVSYASFATNATGAQYGVDLALGSYTGGAVRIPNNSAILGRNAANNADLNVLYLDNTNNVHVGTGAATNISDQSLVPISNNAQTLGSSSNRWSTIYGVAGSFTGVVTSVGVTDGSNAAAGNLGEYQTANASSVNLTSATAANITSISLTAGDWDVSGTVQYVPAGTTTVSFQVSAISTTSATVGGLGTYTTLNTNSNPAGAGSVIASPTVRISVAATTTVYLVGEATFATSTCSANGLIRARRVR